MLLVRKWRRREKKNILEAGLMAKSVGKQKLQGCGCGCLHHCNYHRCRSQSMRGSAVLKETKGCQWKFSILQTPINVCFSLCSPQKQIVFSKFNGNLKKYVILAREQIIIIRSWARYRRKGRHKIVPNSLISQCLCDAVASVIDHKSAEPG